MQVSFVQIALATVPLATAVENGLLKPEVLVAYTAVVVIKYGIDLFNAWKDA